MQVVKGKNVVAVEPAVVSSWAARYEEMIVDLGTGDGRFVGHLARQCAAEVGVDDHAGRVQDTPETRPTDLLELGAQAGGEVARLDARADLLSSLVEHAAGRVDGERIVGRTGKLVHGREVSKLHVS